MLFLILTLLKEATTKRNLIPVAIAAGIDLTEILNKKDLGCWEWSFLEQLNNRIEEYGLSLPFLFLTILSHFLCYGFSRQKQFLISTQTNIENSFSTKMISQYSKKITL